MTTPSNVFYSENKKKRKVEALVVDTMKQNKHSIKYSVKCLFAIRSLIPGIKEKLRHPIFH